MKTIVIIGGGLCGLALGCALRRRGVPVTLHEAGDYPRHKVCGEFLAGCHPSLLRQLAIEPALATARRNDRCQWYHRERPVLNTALPKPVPSLSRFRLDAALAVRFQELGGELRTGSRIRGRSMQSPGYVDCSGRRPNPGSPWVGVKIHLRGIRLGADLEMHLGSHGYTGLCYVEDGCVNLCGLFHRDTLPARTTSRVDYFAALLRANGLSLTAARVAECETDPASFRAVAGLDYRLKPSRGAMPASPEQSGSTPRLGDASGLTPPFTGNGMTLALESAARAVPWLAAWAATPNADWARTCREVARGERRGAGFRLLRARIMQSWLLNPRGQWTLATASRLRLLPFRLIYGMLH